MYDKKLKNNIYIFKNIDKKIIKKKTEIKNLKAKS